MARPGVYLAITDKGTGLLKTIDKNQNSYMESMNRITEKEAKRTGEFLDRLRG